MCIKLKNRQRILIMRKFIPNVKSYYGFLNIYLFIIVQYYEFSIYSTTSSPRFWITDSNRKAGPPGFFTPRSQSETRFFETLR